MSNSKNKPIRTLKDNRDKKRKKEEILTWLNENGPATFKALVQAKKKVFVKGAQSGDDSIETRILSRGPMNNYLNELIESGLVEHKYQYYKLTPLGRREVRKIQVTKLQDRLEILYDVPFDKLQSPKIRIDT